MSQYHWEDWTPYDRWGKGPAPQAHRWALLGNAVSVLVAAWIGKALMHPHRHKYQGARDRRFIGMNAPPEVEEGKFTHCERKVPMQLYSDIHR